MSRFSLCSVKVTWLRVGVGVGLRLGLGLRVRGRARVMARGRLCR